MQHNNQFLNLQIAICGTKGVGKTSAWNMWIYSKTLEHYSSNDAWEKRLKLKARD
jgi:GTPase SAR1 family protein